jgi:hypothetical protein
VADAREVLGRVRAELLARWEFWLGEAQEAPDMLQREFYRGKAEGYACALHVVEDALPVPRRGKGRGK